MTQFYVLGISFDDTRVAMIRKNRPAWQAGSLNFIGGKMESHEGIRDAMVREFEEETGYNTEMDDWKFVGLMSRMNDFTCSIMLNDNVRLDELRTVEDEEIVLVERSRISSDDSLPLISNIRAIYELAVSKDCLDQGAFFEIEYPIDS